MDKKPIDPIVPDEPKAPQSRVPFSAAFFSYLSVCLFGICGGLGVMAFTFYWFVEEAAASPNEFGIIFLGIDAIHFGAGLISTIGFILCFSNGSQKYHSYQQGEKVAPFWGGVVLLYYFLAMVLVLPTIFILL